MIFTEASRANREPHSFPPRRSSDLQATSTLNAPGPTSLVLVGGKTWNNQGTLTIGGDERILFGFTAGGINTLNNTGTLNLSSASSNPLSFWTGTATLNNAGTLNQTLA